MASGHPRLGFCSPEAWLLLIRGLASARPRLGTRVFDCRRVRTDRRALFATHSDQRLRRGLSSGLGAATADAAYAALAGLGLSALTTLMVEHHLWLRLVGGAFLVSLG